MILRYTLHPSPEKHVAVRCDRAGCRAVSAEAGDDENALREARAARFSVSDDGDYCPRHAVTSGC